MSRHLGGLVIMHLACTPARPHPQPVAAIPTVPVASVEIDERIHGRIVGHDGLPVGQAAITVQRFDVAGLDAEIIFADDRGEFTLSDGPERAILDVRIDATDHAPLFLAIDARDPAVELELRLGTGKPPTPPLTALALTAKRIDDPWSVHGGTLQIGTLTMGATFTAGPDGVLTASMPAEPPGVLFSVMGGGQVPTPANAGPLTFWNGFWLIFAESRDGQAHLRVDLSGQPPPNLPAVIEVPRGDATAALVRAQQLALAWGPADDETPADAATCARVTAASADDAASWMHAAHFLRGRGCKLAAQDAVAALSRISADDPRWGLVSDAYAATVTAARTLDPAAADVHEEAFIAGNPNAEMVGELLFTRLGAASGDRARELIASLRAPRFFRGFATRTISHDPDRIDVGRPTPDFSIAALDGGPPVTRASLLGTPHVIDFWGTWCGPCIASLPRVHAAYAKLHGAERPPTDAAGWRGFDLPGKSKIEFVSIAINDEPAAVEQFRREQWPMPWRHAVPDAASKAVLAAFSITGVPVALFVDAEGIVVQRDGDFDAGIAKLLAKRR